jgi:hypothetical protein
MIRAQLIELIDTTEWEDMNSGSENKSLSALAYTEGGGGERVELVKGLNHDSGPIN